IDSGVHAVVVAPLSIVDIGDLVQFFQRDVNDLFDRVGKSVPVFLYDNADIAVNPRAPHIRTRDVKRLSRLEFIRGIKVSAPRRVLGNYTKGALHYQDRGEFGVYVGDAMLIFQVFNLQDGFLGRIREYWNRYLLHNELPIGVVSGPANALPREWQRAWRACYCGDDRLISVYRRAFDLFSDACSFESGGGKTSKTIACVKHALKLQGVITSDRVADGTAPLSREEADEFERRFAAIQRLLRESTDDLWLSRPG
ncbi:MAG TPA: hypothetical protein VEZ90_05940, partial [Blastocatellia bacterium]|nr:hypothetical protein [Blastocatellia bacterium]